MLIETFRLHLRSWRESDREAFAAMNSDPDVMRDLGGPISREQSDAKFDRYVAAWEKNSVGRWAIESTGGDFLGYAGVLESDSSHPLGRHYEAGWRLVRSAWGKGYATEAAKAALADSFTLWG